MAPKTRARRGAAAPDRVTEADSNEWNRLVVLSTISDRSHTVKCVCLSPDLHGTSRVHLFCMTPTGQPLASGYFMTEQNLINIFTAFDTDRSHHPIMDIVFEESDEFPDCEGVIIGARDPNQAITGDNLDSLRQRAQ